MSVFDRLAPLIPRASASCEQTKENLKVCTSPPHSLSSPVIKKKTIQIPSFDEKGLMLEKCTTKHTDSSSKTSSQPLWGYQGSQREKASTLPRAKPRAYSFQALSAKPSISISPAPKPNSSPTFLLSKPKPSDSLYPAASQLSEPSLLMPDPERKLRVSPTLIVPVPRLSPSPTSMCQEISADGARQPSPVATERRAKTIHISNAHLKPLNKTKHDVLDQEALMDFTHPVLGRLPPAMSRDARHQTLPQSHKPPTTSQDLCSLQSTFGSSKKEKPKIATRNTDITVIPKPKSNIKQLQGFQPSDSTQTQTSESEGIKCFIAAHGESHSAFHRLLPTQSSFQTKCTDYPQKSNYMQKSDFTSSHQSFEQIYSKKRAAVTPKMSFPSEPLFSKTVVSPNIESRRRQLRLYKETRADTECLSGSHHNRPQEGKNIKSSEKYRLLLKTQGQSATTDIRSAVCQSDCVSKDYSCQSGGIDPKTKAPQCACRLHRFNTCQVAPQTQEASCPATVECTASLSRPVSKADLQSKTHLLDQDQPPRTDKIHKEVKVRSVGLNHPHILAPADYHEMPAELPEHPSGKCIKSWAPSVMHCPLNTSSSGTGSNGVFASPSQAQHGVYQRPEETKTTSLPSNQPKYSAGERAFIKEDAEDPYYVTMYYPGSVYVGEYKDIQTA